MTRLPASPYYPVLLNIQNKKCLVVGGGEVALRKTQTILEHRASVLCVSPAFCDELNSLSEQGKIQALHKEYETTDLDDVYLVIAATDDPEINEKVATEAKQRKVLINVVDRPDLSDFIVPSYFTRGDIIVAVSTSGRSPALARKIRTELEAALKPEYAQLALIASEVRGELKKNGMEVSAEQWQQALALNSIVELIKRGKNKEVREIILARLNAVPQGKL